jgi:hypothetical protein
MQSRGMSDRDAPAGERIESSEDLTLGWARVGVVFGFVAVISYALISALDVPLAGGLILASVFGPSLAIASTGLYRILRIHKRMVSLDIGVGSNVAAGVAVTLMFYAQLGLKEWFDQHTFDVPTAVSDADLETAKGIYLGLDVAWDLFLAIGTVLLAWNMRHHPRFGQVFAWSGIAIASALLALNLFAFPEPPGDAGSVDLGPLIGLWYLAVTIRMATSLRWVRDQLTTRSSRLPPRGP